MVNSRFFVAVISSGILALLVGCSGSDRNSDQKANREPEQKVGAPNPRLSDNAENQPGYRILSDVLEQKQFKALRKQQSQKNDIFQSMLFVKHTSELGKSRNRNAVHVAIWTIKSNGIETPDEIDFESPNENNVQLLKSLAGDLGKLEAAKLIELDKSLAHHWKMYSPIWGPSKENWD